MFKCLGWPCLATFILLLFETSILTLCLLAPRNTWCGNACFGARDSKYGTWYSERVILQFMCVGCWAGVTYLRCTVLASPKKDETVVHCSDPALSVLVMLVSRNVCYVVSALQSIVCQKMTLFISFSENCFLTVVISTFSGRNFTWATISIIASERKRFCQNLHLACSALLFQWPRPTYLSRVPPRGFNRAFVGIAKKPRFS